MRLKHANRLGMIFLVLAILILLVVPLSNTSFVIDNSVVSSYIVVPMIILPLLAIFTFKEKIIQKPTAAGILIGVVLFALFVLITIALKSDYSQYFVQYRLEMLVSPLGILAIIIIIFGMQSLRKFYALIIYPILASPLTLFYILNGNSAFAQLNSVAVYHTLRLFTSGLSYTPPFTISNSAFAVGIGTACAGLAIFIAIVAFMLPLAYLLDGKIRQKILWVISAVLLLLILTFLESVFAMKSVTALKIFLPFTEKKYLYRSLK